jgi:hypothetical protein
MNGNGTAIFLVLLVWGISIGVSVWLIVLFVCLCSRVKAIKAMLMIAYDLEESKSDSGFAYRKRGRLS